MPSTISGADYYYQQPFVVQYSLSIYLGFLTMANAGYPGITPANVPEMCMAIAGTVISISFFAYVLGFFFNFLVKSDEKAIAYRGLMRGIDGYCTTRGLPDELRQRIIRHCDFQWRRERIEKEAEIVAQMPSTLVLKIANFRHRASVNRCRLLKGVSEALLNQIVLRLKHRYMQPGERLFKEGDMARDLCIVEGGEVEIFHRKCRNAERFRTEKTKDGGSVTSGFIRAINRQSEGGSLVGEHAFFLRMSQPFTMAASETAVTTLLCLGKIDYEEISQLHPSDHNRICSNLLRPLGLKKDGSEMKALSKIKPKKHEKKSKGVSDTGSQAGEGSVAGSSHAGSSHAGSQNQSAAGSESQGSTGGESNASSGGGGSDAKAHRDETSAIARSLKKTIKSVLQKRVQDAITSLLDACAKNELEEIKALLKTEVNVNTPDYDGNVPLHFAASNGNGNVVEVLLLAGADVNLKDRYGHTAMYEAVMKNHQHVVDVLKTRGLELEIADPAGQLCDAASNNDVDLLKRLVDNGITPDGGDYDGRTALHLAASEGNNKIVEWLVGAKANVNVKDRWGNTPLMDAVTHGHEVAARVLFESGGRMDVANASGMMCSAASTGDLTLLRMLHESGCDVRIGDYDGRTPLHLAAAEGQVVAVSFLLAAYADVGSRDRWGYTAIDDAIRAEHLSVAKLLTSAGSPTPSSGIALRPEAQAEYDRLDIAEIRRHAAEGEAMHTRRGRRMKHLEELLKKLVAQLHVQGADNARYSTLLLEMLTKTMPDALTDFNYDEEHQLAPKIGSPFWRLADEANRLEQHVVRRRATLFSSEIQLPGIGSGEVMPRTFNAFILKLSIVQEGLEFLHRAFLRYANVRDYNDEPVLTPEKLVYMIRTELVIATDDVTAHAIESEAGAYGITYKALIASDTFMRLVINGGLDGPPQTQSVQRAFVMLDQGFKLLDINLDGALSKNDLIRSHSDGEITLPPELYSACNSARTGKMLLAEFIVCISYTVDCLVNPAADNDEPMSDDESQMYDELEDTNSNEASAESSEHTLGNGAQLPSGKRSLAGAKNNRRGICAYFKGLLRDASLSSANMQELQVKVLDALLLDVSQSGCDNFTESSGRLAMAIDSAFRLADVDEDGELGVDGFEQFLTSLSLPMPSSVSLTLMQSFRDLRTHRLASDKALKQTDFTQVMLYLHQQRTSTAESSLSERTVSVGVDADSKGSSWHLVVRPEYYSFRCWRATMVALSIYYFFIIPYNISFVCFRDCKVSVLYTEWAADCLLWVDIAINFNLACESASACAVSPRFLPTDIVLAQTQIPSLSAFTSQRRYGCTI